MKKFILSLLAFACAGLLSAQTVINDLNIEKRNLSGFHGIEVATGIQLILTAGATEEVAVSAATTEFRDRIVSKVENGILKLYYESKPHAINRKNEKKELKAYVSYKTLDRLDANTGARVVMNEALQAASMKITAYTGAKINGAINATELEVNQTTGSIITLSGKAGQAKIKGDTGSKFEGEDLVVDLCDVKVNTGARIWINAAKELSAKADTGGNVKYKGDPSVKDIKKTTGGTVSKI